MFLPVDRCRCIKWMQKVWIAFGLDALPTRGSRPKKWKNEPLARKYAPSCQKEVSLCVRTSFTNHPNNVKLQLFPTHTFHKSFKHAQNITKQQSTNHWNNSIHPKETSENSKSPPKIFQNNPSPPKKSSKKLHPPPKISQKTSYHP